jgi:transcriptional regulator with XRE-family HTH domain
MAFGTMLRDARETALPKRSMGELARHMGLTVTFISDVERGRRAPFTPDKILTAARFLGVRAEPLLLAAATERKTIELNAVGARPKMLQVGAGLMRHWTDLTDEQLEQIEKILGGDDRAGEGR